MHLVTRDRAAAVIALVAVVLGIGSLAFGRFDPGVRLHELDGRLYIAAVNEHSDPRRAGVEPGMVVVELNGIELIDLPQLVYPTNAPDGWDPDTGEPVPPIGPVPARPTPLSLSSEALGFMASSPIRSLQAMHPWQLEAGSAVEGWPAAGIWDDGISGIDQSAPALVIGLGLLIVGAWWLASGRAAASLVALALPLAVACAVPFLLRPLAATWSPLAIALTGLLVPLAVLPLGLGLARLVDGDQEQQLVRWASIACALVAAPIGIAQAWTPPWPETTGLLWGLLVGGIAIVPGLAAARLLGPGGVRSATSSSGRLLASTEFAIAGGTPLVALATDRYPYLVPMALWIGGLALAGRFTIRPLARLASRATLQRDLVVAATEAERARVAADIHDDALQELSLLVRRLDSSGDIEGAEIARTVADRLRAICGDLRLPILDDLGVGPALDWLVLRIERLAGGEVRLERTDGTRPPAEVELAFFRVAQEALANAVKHGKPPIVVRYRATDAGASLSIDDSGPGIDPDAGPVAEREGRFGLLNMQQRAEQIGAILQVRPWPGGGTHVALEWRPW